MMGLNDAEAPHGLMTELRAALDAMPADEPRSYLRQSLQLLVPLLAQMHQRLQALEACMGPWSPEVADQSNGLHRRCQQAHEVVRRGMTPSISRQLGLSKP